MIALLIVVDIVLMTLGYHVESGSFVVALVVCMLADAAYLSAIGRRK